MSIEYIYKYNSEWLKIANKYLSNKQDAEDIIQEVYIKIINKVNKGTLKLSDMKYKDTINKNFMYKLIKHTCIDFIRKKKQCLNYEDINIHIHDELLEEEIANNTIFKNILIEVSKWDNKDAELFNTYMRSGLSMKSIAEMEGISKSSVFNSLKVSKNRIKELFGEDMEDYFNEDYELIK